MSSRFHLCPHGVRITFENGWAVSIQWNVGNYCDNQSYERVGQPDLVSDECVNAEVAILYNDQIVGDVIGWQSPDDVAKIIHNVSTRKANFPHQRINFARVLKRSGHAS